MKPPSDLSHKGPAVEEWLDLRFFRPLGIRLARALLPTTVSAHEVTLWSLVIGLVAGHLFAYGDRRTDLMGFALFIVSEVLDSADGQLARLRGASTRFGRALDGISDTVRFINLYVHLAYRLIHAAWSWPGAVLLVALAGLAHAYQSAAVDFVRNAFLHIGFGDEGELDLPEDLPSASRGGAFARFGARVYRRYVVRQSRLFRRSAQLVRRLRRTRVTEAFRAEYRGRQQALLPLCSWLGQNVRLLLLGAAGWERRISVFLWAEAVPMSLLLVLLLLAHERNAATLTDALAGRSNVYAPVG